MYTEWYYCTILLSSHCTRTRTLITSYFLTIQLLNFIDRIVIVHNWKPSFMTHTCKCIEFSFIAAITILSDDPYNSTHFFQSRNPLHRLVSIFHLLSFAVLVPLLDSLNGIECFYCTFRTSEPLLVSCSLGTTFTLHGRNRGKTTSSISPSIKERQWERERLSIWLMTLLQWMWTRRVSQRCSWLNSC